MNPTREGPAGSNDVDVAQNEDVLIEDEGNKPLLRVPEEVGFQKILAYLGPGLLVTLAYLDPTNFQTDLVAGAARKYQLLWVVLWSTIAGMLFQAQAAKLGLVSGKHLSHHCREEYPASASRLLWAMAEISIIAMDSVQVIGTAFAFKLLFGLPLLAGVVLTSLSTVLLSVVQRYGARKLEAVICLTVLLVAGAFFVELLYTQPDYGHAFIGLLRPRPEDTWGALLALSLVGALVSPHKLYLHSALVLSRETQRTERGLRSACSFATAESTVSGTLALLINVAIVLVSGSTCGRGMVAEVARRCRSMHLANAPFLLSHALGGWAYKIFGLALLASATSSTITGTYASQYVRAGFLGVRMVPWLSNLLTRAVSLAPCLIVTIIFGDMGASRLILASAVIAAFQAPYALIPLVKLVCSELKMGEEFRTNRAFEALLWALVGLIVAGNGYLIAHAGIDWYNHNAHGRVAFIGILITGLMTVYLYGGSLIFFAVRPIREPSEGHAGTGGRDSREIREPLLYSEGGASRGASLGVLPASGVDRRRPHTRRSVTSSHPLRVKGDGSVCAETPQWDRRAEGNQRDGSGVMCQRVKRHRPDVGAEDGGQGVDGAKARGRLHGWLAERGGGGRPGATWRCPCGDAWGKKRTQGTGCKDGVRDAQKRQGSLLATRLGHTTRVGKR
eukprot:jgi/Mesvir1/9785/Mv09252-RA.1